MNFIDSFNFDDFYPITLGLVSGILIQKSYFIFNRVLSNKLITFLYLIIISLSSWLFSKIFFYVFSVGIVIRELDFWVSFLLGGGFVFYGALFGGVLSFYLITKISKLNFIHLNSLVPIILYCHSIGRIGCYFAGCCYGISQFPIQLVEAAFLFFLAQYFSKTNSNEVLLFKYLIYYAYIRFFIEFFRGDEIRGIYGFLSTSQWISMFIIFLFAFIRWYRPALISIKRI